ncbi:MAG: hypothetical protein JO232_00270 [Verrucomicrobia bacterium]|nr:hypothetical protein [Verrucomicrobiota bacterium]
MVNSLRLKIGDPEKGDTSRANGSVAPADARSLAWEIAQPTVTQLLAEGLLDRDEALKLLKSYREQIGRPSAAAECLLTYLFSDEVSICRAAQALNKSAHLQTWEFAHRIAPPEAFYRSNAEVCEACRCCGVVVLDVSTPATITTGSLNPVAAEFFLSWLEAKLGGQAGEAKRRFLFHVAIPPRHWTSILRTHFPKNYGF